MDVHSIEAQRAVIFTLWKSNNSAAKIHEALVTAHKENAVTLRTVRNWIERYEAGQTDVADQHRSGRPKNCVTKGLASEIQALLEEDARTTVRELADRLNCPQTTVYRVLTEELELVKITARWVPRLLNDTMRAARATTSQANIDRAGREGWEQLKSLIVTGDETWVPFFAPQTKQETMVWTQRGADPPVKARRDPNTKKIMLTLFFDIQGPLTIDFLAPGATINSDGYVQTLAKLKQDIRNKRRTGSKPIIILHDNARPHTAARTQAAITQLGFQTLDHPPYSPDLAPCDYAIFPSLKKRLRGRVFACQDDREREVRRCLIHEMPREEFAQAINTLYSRWQKCVKLAGGFVEKAHCPSDGSGDEEF